MGRRHLVLLRWAAVPAAGRSLTARALSRYFLDEGTTYTHVSDQHSTDGTKVIPTTWREAVAVLDEIFGNPTELPLGEHTVDTAGQTLATFAIFNLAGQQFSPRIRDIGRLQLYRLGPVSTWRSRYPRYAATCSSLTKDTYADATLTTRSTKPSA